jgi:hypothetical protein
VHVERDLQAYIHIYIYTYIHELANYFIL